MQLRGIGFGTTIDEVWALVGKHTIDLVTEDPVRLIPLRDGSASGVAHVAFVTLDSARRCRDDWWSPMGEYMHTKIYTKFTKITKNTKYELWNLYII